MRFGRAFLRIVSFVAFGWLVFAPLARAQNVTSGVGIGYVVGQGPMTIFIGNTGGTDTERWYTMGLTQGKSYCFETFRASGEYGADVDLVVDVVQPGSGVVVNSFNSIAGDPSLGLASRWTRGCMVATASQEYFVRLHKNLCCVNREGNVQFRILDTTLHGPWWFVSSQSGYDAFVELGNTTTIPVSATVTIRSAAGTTLGTNTLSIPAGGNAALSVANAFGSTITAGSGSVQVAHDGPPGAIVGNVTTLSAATGLSFDSPMAMREGFK